MKKNVKKAVMTPEPDIKAMRAQLVEWITYQAFVERWLTGSTDKTAKLVKKLASRR